ncbi:MAG: HEAT repeat domain-containing protein [Acidobacteriota bacterium]
MQKRTMKKITTLAILLVFVSMVFGSRAIASDQNIERLNRFVQTTSSTDAAMKVFVEGRAFITNKEWAKAAEKFRQVISEYPKSENVDVALYWLAFALKKQDKFNEASEVLAQLVRQHSNSSWVSDARQMQVEIAAATGRSDIVIEEAASSEDEIRIVALQSLFEADPARAASLVSDILKRGSKASARLREAAVSLLGQYGGKEALPALLDLARNEQDPKIRKRAINSLGWKDSDEAFNLLKQLAGGDDEIAETALQAITNYGAHRNRAYSFLVETAKTSKSLKARKLAISGLGRYSNEQVLDELMSIYNANQDIEIRKSIISALGGGGHYLEFAHVSSLYVGSGQGIGSGSSNVITSTTPRPAIAPTAPALVGQQNAQKQRRERAAAILVQLYDVEKDDGLKRRIIYAMANTASKQALNKLMAIARSDASVERKKAAISALGRTRDPEVLLFLEELIK